MVVLATFLQLLLAILGLTFGLEVKVVLDDPHAHLEPEFISFTIDSSVLGRPKWRTFSFTSLRIQTLLKGLSPAYLRLGGTSADYVVFKNEAAKAGWKRTTLVLNTTDVDNLVKLVRTVNLKFLLDLNLQQRNGSHWDPTNAASLLEYINKMKYHDVFNFELGNEPDLFHEHKPEFVTISGTQIGRDFLSLHNLLKRYNFTSFTFVGPDSANVVDKPATSLFKDFLKEAGPVLTAATFHHYYFNGQTAHLSEYTEAKNFDEYQSRVRTVKNIIKKSGTPDLPLWLGEGADAYDGGTPNVSDRYVSGFLWLDKLGVSAHESMGVVMRQCYYGGNYALTDLNNMPNPDYWLSYVHKQLVGTIVLNVSTKEAFDTTLYWEGLWNKTHRPEATTTSEVRVYAHCTKESSRYHKGAVTVFALSVKKSGSEKLSFPAPLSNQTVDVYMLTPVGPEGLTSKLVALNGKTMQLIDDHTLPPLVPVQQQASRGIELPALTFGFCVFPNANASACK